MNKPIVQFSRKVGVVILPGNAAFLLPLNHKSEFVSNTKHAITSYVVRKEVSCCRIVELETENTIYKEFDDET